MPSATTPHTPSRFRAAINAFVQPVAPTNGKRTGASADMRTAISTLVDRMKFGNTFSRFTFGTLRDTWTALGYPAKLSPALYRASYDRDDIAARVVEAYPRATWQGGFSIVEDPDPEVTTKFETKVDKLYRALDIDSSFMRADILSGLGEWSILWMIADGHPSTPLQNSNIHYLAPIGQTSASIKSSVKDVEDARFGLPEFYTVRTDAGSFDVHWSRALHIASGRLDSRVNGQPELQSVWNRFEDLRKIAGGGSEAAWRRMDPGTHFDKDPKAEIDTTEEGDFEDQVDEFYHGYRRYLLTSGVTPTPLTAPVHNFGPNIKSIVSIIAGAKGIPMQMLLGSELGMASAKQDTANFDNRTDERRDMFAEPLIRELTDRFIELRILPKPTEYSVVWPTRDSISAADKSLTIERLTRANKAQTDADGTIVVTSAEMRQDVLSKKALDDAVGIVTRDAADLSDDPPSDVDWSATHAAADRHRDAFATTVESVWTGVDTVTDLSGVDAMLTAIDEAFADVLPDAIFATLADGGQSALEVARTRQSFFRTAAVRSAQFEIDFDTTNPRALDWAADRSSELITEIGPETRAAVQQIIADGVSSGKPPAVIARDINRIVGLRTDQVDALSSFFDRLDRADGGATVFMGDTPIKVPVGGPTDAFVDRQVERYATQLRKQRAMLIARTETLHASNEGQRQLWLQKRDSGDLPTALQRVWIVTPDNRLREEHADREGTVVGVNESWPWGTEPGGEPNCRCAQGLVEAR